ncbi:MULTISPECIES: hypothetical protein [unclassified Campylobacter]|uniref:hypothetical protein n=1 Tax=unclassified Campylobacter TaxID=2593542 RepID=UPI003D32DADE
MMREIVFFVGILLFLAAIWMIKDENISRKAKAVITAVLLCGGIFAYIYESGVSERESQVAQLLSAFHQGKTLICSDKSVSMDKFNYEFGTACFMPKREFIELNGVIVKISDCELASE